MIRKIATIIRWSKRYLQKFLSKYRSIFMLNPVGKHVERDVRSLPIQAFCLFGLRMYYWQSPWWKKRPREVSIVPLAAMNTDNRSFAKQASLQLRISYKDQIYQPTRPFPLRTNTHSGKVSRCPGPPVIRLVINCINRHACENTSIPGDKSNWIIKITTQLYLISDK